MFFQNSSSTKAFGFTAAKAKNLPRMYLAKVTSSCQKGQLPWHPGPNELAGLAVALLVPACLHRLAFGLLTSPLCPHPLAHTPLCPHLVGPSSRVAQKPIEEAEQRELEKQGFHAQVVRQPVQHLGDTVVGVIAVLPVAPQQEHVGSHDGWARKAAPRHGGREDLAPESAAARVRPHRPDHPLSPHRFK